MKNKRKYKFNSGIQQIAMDTPDYSKAYELQAEEGAKNQGIKNAAAQFSGAYAPIGQIGGMAGDVIKSRNKSKGGAQLGGAVSMGSSAAAFGAKMGSFAGPIGTGIGAGVGLLAGGIYGAVKGGKEYTKGKRLQAEADRQAEWDNYNKGFNINGSATDVQARVAKNGKYKVKTKAMGSEEIIDESRLIESEGREPVFSPKMKNGKRKLLFYNPKLPTHEQGGVKMLVVPKEKYNDGTSNLMPKRPASKYSLVGNGNMAYGAKQLKVNTLNDTALSNNLTGMPSANAANKFIQPTAGISQVARNIPEVRRKEKINTPRSHKTKNPDTNRIIDPPMLYEMMPPKPKSTYNTKNDFKTGGKYVKVYAQGTNNLEIKKFAPGGDKIKAKATPEEREAVRKVQRNLGVKDDGFWGPLTQAAWEKKNNITPSKKQTSNLNEDEKEARRIFNIDFARAEKERKADSTLYANRIVPTALAAAKNNKKVYVTENRKGRPDTGKKTGNNACLTGVCNVNKMTGTNLPFNMSIASNPNIKGDNSLETRYNPAFQQNSEKLGYKKLKATDKLQPGDVFQKSISGLADHARLFLGNKKGPLIGEDHGNDDNMGFEVEDINYLNKYNTVNDAMVGNPGLNTYRYMGLPKTKASIEIARAKVKSNKEAIARKKAKQQKQFVASTQNSLPEITPSSEEMSFMKKGSKYVKVYQDGNDGTQAESTHKHTKRFNNRQKYEEALKLHNDSLALHGQSRFFEDAVNSTRKYHPTVETSKEVNKYKRTGVSKGPDPGIDPRPYDYNYGNENNWGDPQAPGFERAFSKDIHPIKTNTYTRKESTYKSKKEYEKKKNPNSHMFFYDIDMYKHPEMSPVYEADTTSNTNIKKPILKIPKDTTPVTRPVKPVIVPKAPEIKLPVEKINPDTTRTTPTATPTKTTKPAARGKFVGKEKTGLQKLGEKATEFLNKIGSSKRKSNGKTVRVFK
jgi:hypothetical protein